MKKERTFVNPFKLFFGASENYNQLSQTDAIDASNLSAEEKAELKKALKEVEKFYKCSLREKLCCLHNVRSRKKRNRIPEKLKRKRK